MGTWASAVTTAVAPLCWENKMLLCTVSGADSITQLPHQGYLVRTQPNTKLQVKRVGEFILSLGAKSVFMMMPQTPFTQSTFEILNAGPAQGRRHAPEPDLRQQEDHLPLRDRPGAAHQARHDPGQRLHAGHHRAAEGPLPRRLQGQDHGLRLLDQPEAHRPDRPARGGRGHLHLRAVAGRGQRAPTRRSRPRSARPIPIPTPARSTTTSTWC